VVALGRGIKTPIWFQELNIIIIIIIITLLFIIFLYYFRADVRATGPITKTAHGHKSRVTILRILKMRTLYQSSHFN
jgi:hypothetical protein